MAPLHTASRAASALPHQGADRTRDIHKKRDKPLLVEQAIVRQKKRQVKTQSVYSKLAPPGYTYVPLGPIALVKRCLELSRQRQLLVYKVNMPHALRFASKAHKVSSHIARIGHHFQSRIVEEACQIEGYQALGGDRFLTNAELQDEYKRRAMIDSLKHSSHNFNIARVKAALERYHEMEKARELLPELFPRVPRDKIKEIIDQAWGGTEDEDRVGNSNLPLARKVQLAVAAHIRHNYTDYDRLLNAFRDWKESRYMVEPNTLEVLLSWMAPLQDKDDQEFEEVEVDVINLTDDDDKSAPATATSQAAADHGVIVLSSDEDYELESPHSREGSVEFLGSRPRVSQAKRFRDYLDANLPHYATRDPVQMFIQARAAFQQQDQHHQLRQDSPEIVMVNAPTAEAPEHIVVGGQLMRRMRESPAVSAHRNLSFAERAPARLRSRSRSPHRKSRPSSKGSQSLYRHRSPDGHRRTSRSSNASRTFYRHSSPDVYRHTQHARHPSPNYHFGNTLRPLPDHNGDSPPVTAVQSIEDHGHYVSQQLRRAEPTIHANVGSLTRSDPNPTGVSAINLVSSDSGSGDGSNHNPSIPYQHASTLPNGAPSAYQQPYNSRAGITTQAPTPAGTIMWQPYAQHNTTMVQGPAAAETYAWQPYAQYNSAITHGTAAAGAYAWQAPQQYPYLYQYPPAYQYPTPQQFPPQPQEQPPLQPVHGAPAPVQQMRI